MCVCVWYVYLRFFITDGAPEAPLATEPEPKTPRACAHIFGEEKFSETKIAAHA